MSLARALPLLGLMSIGCRAPAPGADAKTTAAIASGPESEPESESESEPNSEPIQAAVAGCGLVVDPGPTRRCLLSGPATLHLWLPDQTRAGLELRLDGAALEFEVLAKTEPNSGDPDPGGTMIRVGPLEPRGRLELRRPGARPWSIELREHTPAYEALAQTVGAAEDLDAAQALLAQARPTLGPDEAALSACFLVFHAYGQPAIEPLALSLAGSPAPGCRGLAHLLAVHTLLYDQPDLNAAQRNLEAAEAIPEPDFETILRRTYLRADFELMVGRLDEALRGYQRTIALATLVDDLELVGSAEVMVAMALTRLGRFGEAEARLAELEATLAGPSAAGFDPEVLVDIRYNIAWATLLQRENDPWAPDPKRDPKRDPKPRLDQLIAAYTALDDPKSVARTRLHLALAAAQTGDAGLTRAELDQVNRAALAPFELVWLELVEVRAARMRGEVEVAAAHLERAEIFAELGEDLEQSWHVWSARARLERERGRPEAALAAYEHADELANQLALAVPGTAGRSMLVTAHSHSDAGQLALLLELGRSDDAVCVAAGARARHLRSLWARLRPPPAGPDQAAYQALLSRYDQRHREIEARLDQAWSLSTAELGELHRALASEGAQADALLAEATALLERGAPRWSCAQILPKRPGQALLTMLPEPLGADPVGRGGAPIELGGRWWFLLARADGPTVVVELDLGGPAGAVDLDALGSRVLDELGPALAGVDELVVTPVAEFVAVDLHRALLERPALADISLRYSLGLGEVTGIPSGSRPREAAVVAGARDLDAVTREAAVVSTQLGALGWRVAPDWSPSSPSQPTLLHYAGHGHHTGLAGWGSYIEVPGAGQVSAAQIVAGARAPELVVLGACSAGSSDAEIIDGGMNLAAAFLLAGADLVIAPSGPVDDDVALELGAALYREFNQPDAPALTRALHDHQRAELDAAPQDGPRSRLRWRAWSP